MQHSTWFMGWLVAMLGGSALADDPVFLESDGIVAIEVESTASRLGDWERKTDVEGYSGECHLEFTGNKPETGPPRSPLKYVFQITTPGKYTLTLRARKRLETKRDDISNDCYVAVAGDFAAGGEAPLGVLREDTKMFGGQADGWGWTRSLDVQHKKFPAEYIFRAGETYELTISGRSQNFNLDRILFVHESRDLRRVQNENPAQSAVGGGLGSGNLAPQRVKRTLTNADGVAVEAELIDKDGDMVSILVRGIRHEVPISSLSKADQAFIAEWEP